MDHRIVGTVLPVLEITLAHALRPYLPRSESAAAGGASGAIAGSVPRDILGNP